MDSTTRTDDEQGPEPAEPDLSTEALMARIRRTLHDAADGQLDQARDGAEALGLLHQLSEREEKGPAVRYADPNPALLARLQQLMLEVGEVVERLESADTDGSKRLAAGLRQSLERASGA